MRIQWGDHVSKHIPYPGTPRLGEGGRWDSLLSWKPSDRSGSASDGQQGALAPHQLGVVAPSLGIPPKCLIPTGHLREP